MAPGNRFTWTADVFPKWNWPGEAAATTQPAPLDTILKEFDVYFDNVKTNVPPPPPECTICGTAYPATSVPDSSCAHTPSTCLPCWQKWLDVQVDTKRPGEIKCVECPQVLSQLSIKALATPETFERYLEAEIKVLMSLDPDFRWCISKKCNSGQLHPGDGNIFTCIECKMKACTVCNVKWHQGLTCEQYQNQKRSEQDRKAALARQKTEEDLSTKFVKKNYKLCPGSRCGRNVEKVSGCDHMVCTMCRHEFCWACLASYEKIRKEGNSAHGKGCVHHSNNVRS